MKQGLLERSREDLKWKKGLVRFDMIGQVKVIGTVAAYKELAPCVTTYLL